MFDGVITNYNKHIIVAIDNSGLATLLLSKKLLSLDLSTELSSYACNYCLTPIWGRELSSAECKELKVKKNKFNALYVDEFIVHSHAKSILAAYDSYKRKHKHIKWVNKHIAIVTDLDGLEAVCLSNKLLAANLCISGVRLGLNYGWDAKYVLWPSDIEKDTIKDFRGSYGEYVFINECATKCAKIIKKAYKQHKKKQKAKKEK